jgi:hypothetical protein
MATQRSRLARILSALGDKAEAGDIKAAELFAEYVGHLLRAGVTISNNITSTHNDALADRLDAHHAKRFSRIPGDT